MSYKEKNIKLKNMLEKESVILFPDSNKNPPD